MRNWITHHKIITLAIALIILVGLNLWLFGSNFIGQKQLITANQIDQHNQHLSQVASDASKFANRLSTKPLSQEQVVATLDPMKHQVDEIVLRLQTSAYPKSLDQEVEQTLKLAQVLSFTIHSYQLQPLSALRSANTSQVLHQASINAANLSK